MGSLGVVTFWCYLGVGCDRDLISNDDASQGGDGFRCVLRGHGLGCPGSD